MNINDVYRIAFEQIDKHFHDGFGDHKAYVLGVTDICKAMMEQLDAEFYSERRKWMDLANASLVAIAPNEEQQTEDEPEQPVEPPKKKRHWTKASEVKRMKALADAGNNYTQIAKAIGCSAITVGRKLKGYTPKKTDEPGKGTVDWIRELSAEGESIEDISEATGYSEAVVRKYAGENA